MEAHVISTKHSERFTWCLDALSLGAVLQYAAYRFLQSTMFSIYYPDMYKTITMGLLLLFGGIRWACIFIQKWKKKDSREQRKFLLFCSIAGLISLPFFYVGWIHDYKFLIFLPICCMCLYDMKAEKVFKAFAFTIGIMLAATVLCCLSGTVRNLVKTSENGTIIAAYGICNTTDFASYFTILLLAIWCGMRKREWYWGAIFALLAGVISYLVFRFTESRTVISCGVLIVLFSLWDVFNENILQRKAFLSRIGTGINRISLVAFPLIGIIVIFLTILFAQQNPLAVQIDGVLSGRLQDTLNPYQSYGIHPFGSLIESMHGRGGTLLSYAWSTGYGYIDVAYAMLAIRYGWVITAIVTGLWIWMTVRALKNGNSRIALAMAVLAFHAFSEARVWDINYNIFLIMPFCALHIPMAEKEALKTEKEKGRWTKIILASVIAGFFLLLLPKVLSWLRTFFYSKGWNNGTEAVNSLFICLGIVIYLWLLWITFNKLIRNHNKTAILLLAIVLAFGTAGVLLVNNEINMQLSAQAEELDAEESIVQTIQEAATQPVYAAEASELYSRRFGNVTDHVFSTEELSRLHEGTIFTGKGVEAFGITATGGLYTQISDSTGLYSYDPEVIDKLAKMGYQWTPYYSGEHQIRLSDVAIFNEVENVEQLEGPVQVITSNAETDQYSGRYKVTFVLSGFLGSGDDPAATLEVLGDGGEKQILQEKLYTDDFDSEGRCVHTIDYVIGATPKVSYAISLPENVHLSVDEISWQKQLLDCTGGVEIQPDGSVVMTTDVPDNRFNAIYFLLHDAFTGEYLLDFGSGNINGIVSGEYIHNLPSGLYYVRLKGNTNLADEWIRTPMYIEEGATLHYSYSIDEFSGNRIVVSNVEVYEAEHE